MKKINARKEIEEFYLGEALGSPEENKVIMKKVANRYSQWLRKNIKGFEGAEKIRLNDIKSLLNERDKKRVKKSIDPVMLAKNLFRRLDEKDEGDWKCWPEKEANTEVKFDKTLLSLLRFIAENDLIASKESNEDIHQTIRLGLELQHQPSIRNVLKQYGLLALIEGIQRTDSILRVRNLSNKEILKLADLALDFEDSEEKEVIIKEAHQILIEIITAIFEAMKMGAHITLKKFKVHPRYGAEFILTISQNRAQIEWLFKELNDIPNNTEKKYDRFEQILSKMLPGLEDLKAAYEESKEKPNFVVSEEFLAEQRKKIKMLTNDEKE